MGFALVGLAAGTPEGVQGVIVYMMIYMIMTLGTFACVIAMRRKGRRLRRSPTSPALPRNNKGLAFVFAMLMFSLAGIPPLAGFFAKYFVFLAAVKAGLYALAIIGVVIVGRWCLLLSAHRQDHLFRRAGRSLRQRWIGEVKLVAYAAGAFTLLFVIFANPLIDLAAAGRAVALLRLGGRTSGPAISTGSIPPIIEARRLAEQGERGPLWLVADEQTAAAAASAGTGCREPGNLYATFLFPMSAGPEVAAQVSLLRPSRCMTPSAALRPDLAVRIKWPNDVLIGGAKFCGILSEVVGTSPTRIALGCGINVAHAPKDTPYPVTALGLRCTVESVFQELDSSLSNCLKIWDEGRGFEAIRAAWTAARPGDWRAGYGKHRRRSDQPASSPASRRMVPCCCGPATERCAPIHSGEVRFAALEELRQA